MSKVDVKREINTAFDKKVFEKIRYYLSDEFSNLLVLETANAVYWAKEKGINVASVKERYGALGARQ